MFNIISTTEYGQATVLKAFLLKESFSRSLYSRSANRILLREGLKNGKKILMSF